MQFDRHGNRIWRDAQALLDSEHARRAVGEVAVPFGVCTEPSNVKAGGGACPFRFRCAGCDHFRTDVSYLPDLHAYLDDLLRNRERLLATIDIDDWARAEAMPSNEEITRIRRLIARINGDLDELTRRRARPDRGRRRRGPPPPQRHARHAHGSAKPLPDLPPGAHRMTTADTSSDPAHHRHGRGPPGRHRPPPPTRPRRPRRDAITRRRGDQRRRHRPAPPGSTARFLYRHRDLLEQIHAAEAQPRSDRRPRPGGHPGLAASRPARRPANAPPGCHRAIQHLEHDSPTLLGEHAWRESGLGAPADIDALHQQIIHLEQQVIDLGLQLDERDQDLAAARAANRELMARINAPATTR